MHPEAFGFCCQAALRLPTARVIEVGSANVNGSVRDVFRHSEWIGVDLHAGPGVDIVADWTRMDFPFDEEFDLAVSTEMLEHCELAATAVDRMVRSVRTGGHVVITCATDPRKPHGCDGGPVGDEFYMNVPPEMLEHPQLVPVLSEVNREIGDLYLLAKVVRRPFG